MKKDEILTSWKNETQKLTNYFIERYYGFNFEPDCYWVANEIGGILYINDSFFSLDDICNFIRYNYSKKEMFEYYDLRLKDQIKDKPFPNIENWRKLKKCSIK